MSKKTKSVLIVAFIAISIGSCKNEEEKNAELAVQDYNKFVDSVSKIANSQALANWESIQKDLQTAKAKAEVSVKKVSNKTSLQSSVKRVSTKYDTYKSNLLAEKLREQSIRRKNKIRMELFGESFVANDMEFNWVNKKNILKVYEDFITTVQENKYSYSKQDWDEIKVVYEALDTRKNMLEKEGLSNSKINKIAILEGQFTPMYTFNKSIAKSGINTKSNN